MLSAFQTVLQSYYAPTALLILFSGFLVTDQILSHREKQLFFLEMFVVVALLVTTWIDICATTVTEGDVFWRIRAMASTLQFVLAPLSPMLLCLICHPKHRVEPMALFCLPAAISILLTFTSLWTGLVTHVSPANVYNRGPLFFVPFLASGIYLTCTVYFLSHNNAPGRRMETKAMIGIIITMIVGIVCETAMRLHCIIWSTTTACLILLFFVMTMNKVMYDPLTGAYSRLAYQKRLEGIQRGQHATLAFVDINELKTINDTYGHSAGDQAIAQVSKALLAIHLHSLKLYRYGGDEFVFVGDGHIASRLETELERALKKCGTVGTISLSFAYGIKEYLGGDLYALLEEMDQEMYQKKQLMKQLNPASIEGNP